jgi:hypothetical protein
MRGMKMIEHLGSVEVRYGDSPLPWMHPAGLLASRLPARAWLQAPRCGRLHVSHSLDETAPRAVFLFVLGRSPSRRHGTMQRLLRTGVDEVLRVLLEDPAWNGICQIAPTAGLAYCKLFPS